MCPEDGSKNDPSDVTPLLQGQAERAGALQPGEQKAPRRSYSSLLVPTRKAGEGLFIRARSDRIRGNGFKL